MAMKKNEFTLAQFMNQMLQGRNLGPLGKLIGLIPGMGEMTRQIGDVDHQISRMLAVFHSMSAEERQNPTCSIPRVVVGSRPGQVFASGRSVASSANSRSAAVWPSRSPLLAQFPA